jgi:hypothetical protein
MDLCLVKIFKQVNFKFDSYLVKHAQVIKICPILQNLSEL